MEQMESPALRGSVNLCIRGSLGNQILRRYAGSTVWCSLVLRRHTLSHLLLYCLLLTTVLNTK